MPTKENLSYRIDISVKLTIVLSDMSTTVLQYILCAKTEINGKTSKYVIFLWELQMDKEQELSIIVPPLCSA
jgi:hypothetical protein